MATVEPFCSDCAYAFFAAWNFNFLVNHSNLHFFFGGILISFEFTFKFKSNRRVSIEVQCADRKRVIDTFQLLLLCVLFFFLSLARAACIMQSVLSAIWAYLNRSNICARIKITSQCSLHCFASVTQIVTLSWFQNPESCFSFFRRNEIKKKCREKTCVIVANLMRKCQITSRPIGNQALVWVDQTHSAHDA